MNLHNILRVALKIHFGGQTNLFVPGGVRQKPLYHPDKALFVFLAENNPDVSGLLAAQKQFLEPPLIYWSVKPTFNLPMKTINPPSSIYKNPEIRYKKSGAALTNNTEKGYFGPIQWIVTKNN